jgi:hypothetical protein
VVNKRDVVLTITEIRKLQDFLARIEHAEHFLGPSMAYCAQLLADFDLDSDYSVSGELDLANKDETFATFFRTSMARVFYDMDVNCLIHHHQNGAFVHSAMPGSEEASEVPVMEMCGRCAAEKKPPYKKRFKTCRSSIINGVRMMDGACTNCAFNGGSAACSFCKFFFDHPSVLSLCPFSRL